jgi:hypothetical protein
LYAAAMKTNPALLDALAHAALRGRASAEKLAQRLSAVMGSLSSDNPLTREQVAEILGMEAMPAVGVNPSREGWRPIEIAPQDIECLVCIPNRSGATIFVATFLGDGWWIDDGNCGMLQLVKQPTHWLPLPPAPCDERPQGQDPQGLGGDSPASAVDGASSVVEAPEQVISRLSRRVEELEEETARLKRRLEIDHCYDINGNPQPWEGDTSIDGIFCRDETIKGQDEAIYRLRQRRAALETALEPFALAADQAKGADDYDAYNVILVGHLRRARSALSQSGEST